MLDIELIRSDPEFVRTALLKRVDDVDLGPILEADALRRKLAPRSTRPGPSGTGRPRRSAG
jgi:seryl-tRNA synthetase